jgi:hypothetical protein
MRVSSALVCKAISSTLREREANYFNFYECGDFGSLEAVAVEEQINTFTKSKHGHRQWSRQDRIRSDLHG